MCEEQFSGLADVVSVFSERLRSEVATRRWTQVELGQAVGSTQQTAGRWINGDNLPRRRTVLAIAGAFRQDPSEWLSLWSVAVIDEGAGSDPPDDRKRDRALAKIRRDLDRLTAEVQRLSEE
jgi:transcriptional regulator with XRE-family HTH domain